jgi:hypothetical protein
LATVKLQPPFPLPPFAVRTSGVRYVPLREVRFTVLCVPSPNETEACVEVAEVKFASAAFDAVTKHEPAPVAESRVPLSEQVVVPLAITKLTFPSPLPPEVTSCNGTP